MRSYFARWPRTWPSRIAGRRYGGDPSTHGRHAWVKMIFSPNHLTFFFSRIIKFCRLSCSQDNAQQQRICLASLSRMWYTHFYFGEVHKHSFHLDFWTIWSAATKRELLKLTQLTACDTSMIRVPENIYKYLNEAWVSRTRLVLSGMKRFKRVSTSSCRHDFNCYIGHTSLR